MQYVGIDLHRKQMTVSLRNQNGDVLLRRQVSTRWPKLEEFGNQLHEAIAAREKYVAVVEVCGFHDWLVQWLRQDERCHQVLVVQPLGRSASKTDRLCSSALTQVSCVAAPFMMVLSYIIEPLSAGESSDPESHCHEPAAALCSRSRQCADRHRRRARRAGRGAGR